jgi:RHS repeat-associated protein
LNGITENYSYDALYELTQVTQGNTPTESYTYDLVGNRLSSIGVPLYNYNSSNELTSNSLGNSTYDNNGNTLTDPSGIQYTWDFENRLVQAVVPGTNGGTTAFKYDPFGRRIQKSGPLGLTNYVYDNDATIEELDGAGGILSRYTPGQGIDEPLAQLHSGTTSYYNADGLGSITSLTNTSATAVATYGYDAFGNLSASTGSLTNPFRYTGREFDSETGLYYYRARYYDPISARFISEDPSGFGGGDDFYVYTDENPATLNDPLGLQSSVSNALTTLRNWASGLSNSSTLSGGRDLGQWGLGSAGGNSHSNDAVTADLSKSPAMDDIRDKVKKKGFNGARKRFWYHWQETSPCGCSK